MIPTAPSGLPGETGSTEEKGNDLQALETSNTAGRKFLNHDGIYQNYVGITPDGTKVGGRIIATSFDRKIYVLSCRWPSEYSTVFVENVYEKVRHSIKAK